MVTDPTPADLALVRAEQKVHPGEALETTVARLLRDLSAERGRCVAVVRAHEEQGIEDLIAAIEADITDGTVPI